MRFALIDLGTNAVRFDVHDIGPDGLARRLHRERLAVRLGEGVFQRGRIGAAALRRTVAAFQSFHKTCRDLAVEKITAFGTSALRDASNSEFVLQTLRRQSGIDVRVISGPGGSPPDRPGRARPPGRRPRPGGAGGHRRRERGDHFLPGPANPPIQQF
ncbi:MAG: hypothetical protein IPP68_02735 [Elusimicrobia bacterium]|nr:hypothetical protein [Elusimicrobiota bacterium]